MNNHNHNLMKHIRARVPGGFLWHDLAASFKYSKYGSKIGMKQVLHAIAIIFIGGKNAGKQRIIAELKEPYPVMYHYTEEKNAESILQKGLLPNGGKPGGLDSVFMTDCLNKSWIKAMWLSGKTSCFRIDSARLILLGHKINVLNSINEFTTDYVPPECIERIEIEQSVIRKKK